MRAVLPEAVDERKISGFEHVRQLRALNARTIQEAVKEEHTNASPDLLVGARNEAHDLRRGEKTKPGDRADDVEVARGEPQGWRLFRTVEEGTAA